MTMVAPHLRQRILARRSWTLSSAIEYLAEQAGQEIFTIGLMVPDDARCDASYLAGFSRAPPARRACPRFGPVRGGTVLSFLENSASTCASPCSGNSVISAG